MVKSVSKKLKERKGISSDLFAAISVALVLIPQSLAYAHLAGLPLQLGLYAGFIPVIIGGLLSSSRFISIGPTAVISLLIFSSLSSLADPGSAQYIEFAILLAFLTGIIQLTSGFLKIGEVADLISHPVMIGFSNAAAVIIGFSQLDKLLGINNIQGHSFIENLINLFSRLNETDRDTMIIGISSLILILILKKYLKKIPAAPLVIFLMILFSIVTNFSGNIVGTIYSGLPQFMLSVPSFNDIKLILPKALLIAIFGYVESISIARTVAIKTRESINSNRELLTQGIANLASSVSGAFPVAGSFSRTILNFSSGAKSGLSSIFVGIIILATLMFFTKIFYFLPLAVLGAVIISAVTKLFNYWEAKHILQINKFDGISLIITFIAIIYFAPHLEYGLIIGVIFTICGHLYQSARHPILVFRCDDIEFCNNHHFRLKQYKTNKEVIAVCFDHSLTFTNALHFENVVKNAINIDPEVKAILIMGRSINRIDSSGLESIEKTYNYLQSKKIKLLFSGLNPNVKTSFKESGLFNKIGKSNFFRRVNKALELINKNGK